MIIALLIIGIVLYLMIAGALFAIWDSDFYASTTVSFFCSLVWPLYLPFGLGVYIAEKYN